MTSLPAEHKPAVGILAGRGVYPLILAELLVAARKKLVLVGLEGQFQGPLPEAVSAFAQFPLGALRKTARFSGENGASRIYFAGGVHWPSALATMRPDSSSLALLPRLLGKGDNGLLRAVASHFERLGLEVADPSPLLGELFAGRGLLAGPAPPAVVSADLKLARRVALKLGRADKGQAVVAGRGQVLGVERRDGTDALLMRAGVKGAVLVKAVKPGQDRRFDMPAIGPSTLLLARAVGLLAIGVEAGGVLIFDRYRVFTLAAKFGISLLGE